MFRIRFLLCAPVVLFTFCGCEPRPSRTSATGTYGVLTNPLPQSGISGEQKKPFISQPWTNGELAVIHTEFSPATLFHSSSKSLSFFTHMPETGLGGPSYAAISTQQGPKIFQPGAFIDPSRLRESWFVVWFAEASGWTNWDSPWFLTLQHRPTKIHFDTNGLHFTFTREAGYAALMPMYGYYKPAQFAQQSLPFYQAVEKKKRILSWEWNKALPADPLARARYWASALREFPIHCDESFSVDRAHDNVTFRQAFHWLSWDDDWNTKHLKVAPVSPVLALAYKEGFPAEFSKKVFDMEIPTLSGPLYGVEEVDSYDVMLPVLRYVNEAAGPGSSGGWSNAPCFEAWQQAHANNVWEEVRPRWPSLRANFQSATNAGWAAFGANISSSLDQTANALGAARLAYRLADAETYAAACDQMARALTGFIAQQRGVNYFREHQPWHSMEPLESLPADWRITTKLADVSNMPPDLARIWQDAQPIAAAASKPTMQKVERLIPGYAPTSFLTRDKAMANARTVDLIYALETESRANLATSARPEWPRMIWPHWKTPSGVAWNFGQVASSTNSPTAIQTVPLNSAARVTIYTVR